MGSLGSYIREAREARGLDLRDAAQQTRISLAYLKAIEEEDFSKLPGEVFVKGFLKSYGKFLQLPEDEIMKRYAEAGAPQPAPAAAPAAPKAPKTAVPRKPAAVEPQPAVPAEERPARLGVEPFLWAGAVVIGLVVFIMTALPHKPKTAKHAPAVATQGSSTSAVGSAPTATTKPEKLYLDIVALDDAWVLVRTDSSPQKKAVLKKGETVTWSADERFLLSYSSIGSAKLVLNGKELTVNGPKSAVVRDLIVTASGIALQKVESDQPRPRKPKPVTQPTTTGQVAPAQPAVAAPASVPPPAAAVPAETPPAPAPIFLPPREQ